MEIVELSKQLFDGKEVRILGTKENPLFAANDIGELLNIKNIRKTIEKYNSEEKVVRESYTPGGKQMMTYLTKDGLYKLMYKKETPLTIAFRKWVSKVIDEIRFTGQYNLKDDIEKQKELESQLAQKDNEIAALKRQSVVQPVIYHEYDINEFTDKPCVYLIGLSSTEYKFGISGEIDYRSNQHFCNFRKLGLEPRIIKLWNCETMKIMKDTEYKIKLFAKHNNIISDKFNQKEILTTDNIEPVVIAITKYVDRQNSNHLKLSDTYEIEMKLELEKMKLENRKLEIEMKKLEIIDKKIGMEASVYETGKMIQEINQLIENGPLASCRNQYEEINGHIVPCKKLSEYEDIKKVLDDWIVGNPPGYDESLRDYFARITKANKGLAPSHSIINEIMKANGYTSVNLGTYYVWRKNN